MKTKISIFVVAWLLAISVPAYAEPIETPATNAFLIDVNTGTVLLDKKGEEHMPTSSMSKTMTPA